MKTPVNFFLTAQARSIPKSLASAAVILSLTACGADGLDSVESSLANGEDVNINLSTNDDGDLVVSLSDDDENTGEDAAGDTSIYNETVSFSLNSDVTVPPANAPGASGEATITVNTQTGAISGSVSVSGLTGTPTAAHVHAGAAGEAGPVVVGLESNDDGTVWSIPDGAALDAASIALFQSGSLYINVHTEANAPGEIRGQLVDEVTAIYDETVSFTLNSEVTVPPANVAGATGDATINVNTETGAVSGSVTVSGLTGTPTAAHIHAGAAGEAGPVVVGLESNADGSVWSVPEGATLDADSLALFEAGSLYINIHTEANAPGEIRGQLVNDSGDATGGSVTVTLTNTSVYQPMTPPVVVLHNAPHAENGMRLFQEGQPANPAVVSIAEDGNNTPLVNLLGYLADQGRASEFGLGFADPANPGPLLPGMSATVELDLASDDQVLSIVSMVVCTNDGFSAVDSHTLSAGSETFLAPIYDAGSETNVLMLDYWVPPCGTSANITDDENGSITAHPGQSGSENSIFDFEAGTRYLEITVTRN